MARRRTMERGGGVCGWVWTQHGNGRGEKRNARRWRWCSSQTGGACLLFASAVTEVRAVSSAPPRARSLACRGLPVPLEPFFLISNGRWDCEEWEGAVNQRFLDFFCLCLGADLVGDPGWIKVRSIWFSTSIYVGFSLLGGTIPRDWLGGSDVGMVCGSWGSVHSMFRESWAHFGLLGDVRGNVGGLFFLFTPWWTSFLLFSLMY
jgi:hypothetical protein